MTWEMLVQELHICNEEKKKSSSLIKIKVKNVKTEKNHI